MGADDYHLGMSARSFAQVLGMDVGGTSTRALLIDPQGNRLGSGRAGGGNPIANGEAVAQANVRQAVRDCLAGHDYAAVDAVVIGMAGGMAVERSNTADAMARMLHDLGLRCRINLVSDTTVAFASGTTQPDGTVLIAGTGAVACAIQDWALTNRRADGYGWLLGDLGSGSWLGKRAVYATLKHLSGHTAASELTDSVIESLVATPNPTVNDVIIAAMASEPVTLSRLAPLVTRAAEADDPTALSIVDQAVSHLSETVSLVHRQQEESPIVLAGSLAISPTIMSKRLREKIGALFPNSPVSEGRDGVAGASWLAARRVCDDQAELRRLHARLLQP